LWRHGKGRPLPRPEATNYPDKDSEGDTIYANTHFINKAEAWEWLHDDAAAHISLVASRIEQARSALRTAEQDAADAVVREANIRAMFEDDQHQPRDERKEKR
jgi:hypothetical protein